MAKIFIKQQKFLFFLFENLHINDSRNEDQTSAYIKTEVASKRKLITENTEFILN